MFAELCITSNFTFLTGASHPEEYMERAALAGLTAIAIADENSVAGIVRAHSQAREIRHQIAERDEIESRDGPIGPPAPGKLPAMPAQQAPFQGEDWRGGKTSRAGQRSGEDDETGADDKDPPSAPIRNIPRLIPAARLVFREGVQITALAASRQGWATLCRLISKGRLRAPKGQCDLGLDDLPDDMTGLELILHPPPQAPTSQTGAGPWLTQARGLSRRLSRQMHLALAPGYDGQDHARLDAQARLARDLNLPTIATAEPMMHHGRRRRLADVLTAIRTGCRVDQLGARALANGERRLRSETEMRRLMGPHAEAVTRAADLAQRCTFDIASLRYEYPSEIAEGETAQARLTRLAQEGLDWRYPQGAPDKVRAMLDHELRLIAKLNYEPYFLTVRDIVHFARSRGILCQGRGSAANSVTCYCLGVTSVSPEIGTMVFERFVSEARDEPPDIDVDFEHERREEVIQHIYDRYGRHRAGLCATVIHYRGKRAIREVGAAMGLSRDTIGALSSQLWGFFSTRGLERERMAEIGLDPDDRRLMLTMDLIYEIIGFPRHLSQHVGGFVMTEGRLDELVPIENATMEGRTVIPWDKDDIDALGILKVDVLALGMLTCIRKAFDLIQRHHGLTHSLATLPPEDPRVYDMLCRADSVGVFQVESRAQMNFLPRMRPRCFYDLVIEVAIVRPGPIQGDMVHPYIRRRNGEEEVSFPSDDLGRVLGKTLGVPLFQEQAMQIAITGAGFTPTEADRLRRSLATFKKHGNVSEFRGRFLKGMAQNGYDANFAERCFSQIEGFGSYGFPESHAASFALLVYASAWLKHHHPGIFACALLNAQPMGFYAPAQIVRDAREHGVRVLPVCINASFWDNTMEPDGQGGLALRLGFRQIKGLKEEDAAWIAGARGNGYRSVRDVWRRAGLGREVLARLAEADVFATLDLDRRTALWEAKALSNGPDLPLFALDMEGEAIAEAAAELPAMTLGEQVVEDFVAMRLSLRAHPVTLLRPLLTPDPDFPAKNRIEPRPAAPDGTDAGVFLPRRRQELRQLASAGHRHPRNETLPIPMTRGNPD